MCNDSFSSKAVIGTWPRSTLLCKVVPGCREKTPPPKLATKGVKGGCYCHNYVVLYNIPLTPDRPPTPVHNRGGAVVLHAVWYTSC